MKAEPNIFEILWAALWALARIVLTFVSAYYLINGVITQDAWMTVLPIVWLVVNGLESIREQIEKANK